MLLGWGFGILGFLWLFDDGVTGFASMVMVLLLCIQQS